MRAPGPQTRADGRRGPPIQARRRYTYIFSVDSPLDEDLPLTIDPTGVHMRSYGAHDYLVGCPPSARTPPSTSTTSTTRKTSGSVARGGSPGE